MHISLEKNQPICVVIHYIVGGLTGRGKILTVEVICWDEHLGVLEYLERCDLCVLSCDDFLNGVQSNEGTIYLLSSVAHCLISI